MHRAFAILLYVLATALLATAVWWTTLGTALTALDAKGRSDLDLAADRLRLELQRTRDLAVILAEDPALRFGVLRPDDVSISPLRLQHFADRSGASDIVVVDRTGRVLASSAGTAGDLSGTQWFQRTRHGALGLGPMPTGRSLAHGAPVFGRDGRMAGAVAVVRDLPTLESSWRGDPLAIYFTDKAGRVVVSNREELLAGPPPQDLRPFQGHDIRVIEAGRYIPRDALHLEIPVETLGLTAEVLLDTAPARALALARAQAAAAALLVLGAALIFLWERRRVLARANMQLEARVLDRTQALTEANARLTDEVRERREAEARLTRAQADLVQAGKLSALGQMSAGISHELNQPLMAIRSFAQNAVTFLERGNTEASAGNLQRIGDLAGRMGRIIRNLSSFARAEPQDAVETDLATVVEAALEITETRRREAGIETRLILDPGPVLAMGGEVRLGQVLVNLIGNAIDAMEQSAEKVLTVTLADNPPCLTVRDTGTGLENGEKIFDPFYTTKEVGAGLGLGLSISYGIVAGFGGTIRGRNTGDGAEFSVTLPPVAATQEDAA
ncbi:ATP-binding protein [Jannaschia pohangensis]|uniref:C4-dicarboxylate transport sensor protein DctB n=1 Tax=Jannaschia pohangensis TaxID=390807 RepID=A0A1I3I3E3_9RHOB|nr:ATP-binding protein [Jannaschia pohangensis]SFI42313.1 two-component system, NtrC family, C4-dicarboxylate transport sensor histidine kinase DctB [Jannaschia pohangensis]